MTIDIPKRISLAQQIAESIRAGIERRLWKEFLPGERRLAELFHVSRPTIGTALRILSKDGLISIRHGHRNRIKARGGRPSPDRRRVVAIITHEPLAVMSPQSLYSVVQMRAHLAEQGFLTEIFVCSARDGEVQRRKAKQFLTQTDVVCCVLVSLRRELQQWFALQSVPALVLGSCHASVQLPSLDIDYRGVCRHAAGTFLANGHRRIALVIPDSGGAGELASEAGLHEALAGRGSAMHAEAVIVRHQGSARSIGNHLDAVFRSPHAPTALLVAKPQHVFIVVIYLLKHGLSVPGTVSLIARDSDNLFAKVSPSIAHYDVQGDSFNHKLSRLISTLVSRRELSARPNLIFPRFVSGETVRDVRGT